MSNLAQLASKLQAKDAERSVLNDDIKACEALKSQGKEKTNKYDIYDTYDEAIKQ